MEVAEARDVVSKNYMLFMYYANRLHGDPNDTCNQLVVMFMEKYKTWKREYALSTFLRLLMLKVYDEHNKEVRWLKTHKTNASPSILNDTEIYDPWNREEMDKTKFTKLLAKGLDRIDPKARGMILDFYYRDMNYAEIGKKYGYSRQGVIDIIRRNLIRLQPFLKEFIDDPSST